MALKRPCLSSRANRARGHRAPPLSPSRRGGIVKGYLGKQQLSRATISSNSFDPHSVGWILFSRVERKHSDHDYSLLIYPRKYIIVEFSILFVQVIFASILFFFQVSFPRRERSSLVNRASSMVILHKAVAQP